MSKKTTKSTRTTKTHISRILKSKWTLLGVLIFIVLAIAGYVGYQRYLDKVDRERFAVAAQEVEELHTKLQAVDANVVWEHGNGCRKGGAKFQKPIVGCDSSTVAKILVTNIPSEELKQLSMKYKQTMDNSGIFQVTESSNRPLPVSINEFRGDTYQGKTDLVCSSLYEIKGDDGDHNKRTLVISFSCGGEARHQYEINKTLVN